MFERPDIQKITSRLKEPRAFIQVLMGPRQVGKSTLTGQVLAKLNIAHLFVSADAVAGSGGDMARAAVGNCAFPAQVDGSH